jgi:glycosyltransferase involved in cell wall biosynthesis
MIVPAYNEQDNIVETVNKICSVKNIIRGAEVDYIVINDGSTDNTQKVCESAGIKCLKLMQNLGIGGAVQTGYKYAYLCGYDIAVQFDGDGQHDIASLQQLIDPILNNECDFVVGSRFVDGSSQFKSTRMRRVGISWLSKVIKIFAGITIKDPTSGYRAANRKCIQFFANNYPIDYPEPEAIVMLAKKKMSVFEKQVNMFEREGGESSINMWKSVYYMFKVTLAIVCTSFQKVASLEEE